MPIARCIKNGQLGWKAYKDSPTCYIGPDAKKNAIKALIAIEISKYKGNKEKAYRIFRKEMAEQSEIRTHFEEILANANSSDEEVGWASDVLGLSLHQRLNLSINRRILKQQKQQSINK